MRFLLFVGGSSLGLLACGVGHSASLDPTPIDVDAGALDGGVAAPDATSPIDATNPAPCAGALPSYPTAACGGSTPRGYAPMPGCAPGGGEHCAATSSCAIDESTCGSTSTCLPTAANTGPTWDFRMRRIDVSAPASLASPFVQNAIFTHNVDLKAPQCGESGYGALNWLLRFDSAASTLTAGGAPPATDPLHAGFCFDRQNSVTSSLAPQTVCTSSSADGIVQSGTIESLNVPIFINGQVDDMIFLPLHAVQFSRVHVSADHTCIGRLNPGALDSQCAEVDPTACERWHTDGAVAGYMTLEEADQVSVPDLSESLCVLLTETPKGPDGKCARTAAGAIQSQGDYCAATHAPGGCADSVWFAATFAAAAVTINDGITDPLCH